MNLEMHLLYYGGGSMGYLLYYSWGIESFIHCIMLEGLRDTYVIFAEELGVVFTVLWWRE